MPEQLKAQEIDQLLHEEVRDCILGSWLVGNQAQNPEQGGIFDLGAGGSAKVQMR